MNERILVIDDEEVIRQLLQRTLQKEGYFVDTAEDGSVAVEKIKANFYNLLITDLKMPRFDGISVLKEVKKSNPYIEVIVVTGYPTIESAVESIKVGAFDYLCKPFDIMEVQQTIKKCLERQKFIINRVQLTELQTLFEVSKSLSTEANLDHILRTTLDSALNVVNAKRGSIVLMDDKTNEMSIRVARGLDESVVNATRIRLGQGIVGTVALEGKPALVKDITTNEKFGKENGAGYDTVSFLSLPMINTNGAEKDVLGVINVADKTNGESFTERDQTLLSVLVGQAVTAIENFKLFQQLQDKVSKLQNAIGELNMMQSQLIQSEKMSAVGQLAFGIAHEIRNPLGIILGGVEFLNTSLGEDVQNDKVVQEAIAKIKHSIDRANNIVIELLKFSRTSTMELVPVDLGAVLDDAVGLIKDEARFSNIQISKQLAGPALVLADPNMLRQVFFNLFVNAIDAMPHGGLLALKSAVQKDPRDGSQMVTLEVSDTGDGIPEQVLGKIFDPFFTTKETGKGTGLGLSIVKLILERHHGTIDVRSVVSKGTTFTIRLPFQEAR